MAIKRITNMEILTKMILQRSYSKNNDVKILENNGWDDTCSGWYMEGYVDGLSYVFSLINPEIDFEKYISLILDNEVEDLSDIKPGVILASKKAFVPNNLSIVLSSVKTNEGYNLTVTPIIDGSEQYKFEKEYNLKSIDLPNIYSEKISIDLGKMYPLNLKFKDLSQIASFFSIIYTINDDYVKEIIAAFESYDKEMEKLYNEATGQK